jgi:hypothetical protein
VASPTLTYPNYAGSVTLRNVASKQGFFRLDMVNNSYVGYTRCYGCHDDKINAWLETRHSTVVNSNTIPAQFLASCENCHGPAGAHVSVNGTGFYHPVNTVASEVCGGCHDGRYPTYDEWTNSAHATVTPDVASGFADTPSGQSRMMSCGPCHSGATRVAMLTDYATRLTGYTNYLTLPSANDATGFGQTCAVCHDPHSTNTGPHQLRGPLASTNFYTFFTGSVSTTVLSTNVFGQVSTNTYFLNTVFSTQYVASVQICAQCHNSRGALWTDTSRPPHNSPQYNILLGDIGEFPSGVQSYQPSTHARFFTNQCVDCHMQSSPYQSPASPAVTGHKFTVDNFSVCVQCHGPFASNLVAFAETGFLPAQTQQAVIALNFWASTKAPASLWTKYGNRAWEYTTPGVLSTGGPGPSTSEQALIPDAIKKARFDLYLANNDAASGIHNPLYVITLVNAAISWVQQELEP